MVDGRHSVDDMGRGSWLASRRRERHAIGSAGDSGGDGATLTKSLSDRRGDEAACDHAKHGGVWPVGATKDRGIEEIVVASVGLDDGWQQCGAGVDGSFHDAAGDPLVNASKFVDLAAMVSYAHAKGVRVGWYHK